MSDCTARDSSPAGNETFRTHPDRRIRGLRSLPYNGYWVSFSVMKIPMGGAKVEYAQSNNSGSPQCLLGMILPFSFGEGLPSRDLFYCRTSPQIHHCSIRMIYYKVGTRKTV